MSIEAQIVGDSPFHFGSNLLEATGNKDNTLYLFGEGDLLPLATILLSSVEQDGGQAHIHNIGSDLVKIVSVRSGGRQEVVEYPGLVMIGGNQ